MPLTSVFLLLLSLDIKLLLLIVLRPSVSLVCKKWGLAHAHKNAAHLLAAPGHAGDTRGPTYSSSSTWLGDGFPESQAICKNPEVAVIGIRAHQSKPLFLRSKTRCVAILKEAPEMLEIRKARAQQHIAYLK
jgi:hypothetical protein